MYGSGETCGMYIDPKVHSEDEHLFQQKIRGLLREMEPVSSRWPKVHVFGSARRLFRRRFDVTAPLFTSGCPAVSERAMSLLQPVWEGYVEWLPLKHRGDLKFYIAHPLAVFDVLDKAKSAITYVTGYPEEAQFITSLHKEWIYDSDDLFNTPIFCTPESAGRAHFVSSETVNFIKANGISGAAFEKIGISSR
jgi:hypothetical protein